MMTERSQPGFDPWSSSNAWDASPPLEKLDVPVASTSKHVQEDWGAGSDDDEPAITARSMATEEEDDFGDFDDGEAAFDEEAESFDFRPAASAEQMAPLILALFERIFPDAAASLSVEPERQIGGDAQTLVTEESRRLFALLSQPPPVRPVDWKRSRVRREHLVALGVPVNVDEFATPETPVLPPLMTSVPASRNGPSSAPVSASPSATHRPAPRVSFSGQRSAPPIDRARAAELLALSEEQLTLLPLAKLEVMRKELQDLAADASSNLTKALERREHLASAGEAFDVKIQELVAAAQRLKPGGAAVNVKRSASTSSRWGRNSPNRPASPASGGSGRR